MNARTTATEADTQHRTSVGAADRPGVRQDDQERAIVAIVRQRPAWMTSAAIQLVFLLGLGGVFLANAAVAVFEPAAFEELVADCPIGGLMGDGAWLAPVIAVNDTLVGTAVIAAH